MYLKLLLAKGIKEPKKVLAGLKSVIDNRRAATIIVSYPKTGRTWLRVMLGKYLAAVLRLSDRQILKINRLSKQAGLGLVIFSHGGPFNLYDYSPFADLKFKPGLYQNKKVVFLIRDIRDTLVSAYFQESKRNKVYSGDLSSFIRSDHLGVKKIIAFYNLWFLNRQKCQDFLLVRYEAMHQDAGRELRRVLEFLGLKDISAPVIKKAVEYASFANMRRLEEKRRLADSSLQPARSDDKESYKVRRGKIGGYVDYLSPADIAYIDKTVKEMSLAGCDWYYWPG